MLVLDELKYSEDHIWIRYEENHTVTLGITDFGQLQFGKLNHVELLNEGDEIVTSGQFLIDSESSLKASFSRISGE